MPELDQASFRRQYWAAADTILALLASDGVTLDGKRVADIGCGDGAVALGLVRRARPAEVVGFDIAPTEVSALLARARQEGLPDTMPANLRFVTSSLEHIPAPTQSFDIAFAWWTLEYMRRPIAMCKEIGRILRRSGVLVVGVSHHLAADPQHRRSFEDVQRALLAAGILIAKVELEEPIVRIEPQFAHRPFSEAARGEARMLAISPATRPVRLANRVVRALRRRARSRIAAARPRSPAPEGVPRATADDPAAQWFREHYVEAADKILQFLGEDGVSLTGLKVADIGCGDGIIDLGVATRGRPAALVGYDLNPTNVEHLQEQARRCGVPDQLPTGLSFKRSEPTAIPAPDHEYDVVFSWSAFEHIESPVAMAREIRRVLRPDGVLMLQLHPFYLSEHGPHLWRWFPQGFQHLLRSLEELRAETSRRAGEDDPEALATVNAYLSGTGLDDLQRALLAGGLRTIKIQLMGGAIHVPPRLAYYSLLDLVVSGVNLLAVPLDEVRVQDPSRAKD